MTINSEHLLYSATVLVAALMAASIVYLIIKRLIKGRLSSIKIKGKDYELRRILKPLRLFIPAVFLLTALPLVHLPQLYLDYILSGIKIAMIVSMGWFAVVTVRFLSIFFMSQYDISAKDNLQARKMYTQIRLLENVLIVIICIITFAVGLMTFTKAREIGMSIMASAGVLGIIIGFAAQKTLGNLIAGIQLAITQPIRVDDVVIIENEWGWIEEINLTFVVVRIWDLRRLVVPLSYFMEKPFQNWTRTSADILGSVFLSVDYTVPVEDIRQELTRILEGHELWDKKVNVLHVTNMSDHVVELRALMSAKDSPSAWELRCNVRERLLNYLQEKYPESLPKIRLNMEQKKYKIS